VASTSRNDASRPDRPGPGRRGSREQTAGAGEFVVAGGADYDRRSPTRWILSHLGRLGSLPLVFIVTAVATNLLNSLVPRYTGSAFDHIIGDAPNRMGYLVHVALVLLGIVLARGLFDGAARYLIVVIANRLVRDTRLELFTNLLGKSQTFHNRQRVGDLMARATNDVRQIGFMFSPGFDLLIDSMTALVVPLIFIGLLDYRLLLAPGLFTIGFALALWHYMRKLNPVSTAMREEFGSLNAGLNEAVRGIEVIKATGQEAAERVRFNGRARAYRREFVKQGIVQAWYLPTLLLAVMTAGGLLHAVVLMRAGELTIGGLITYLGLLGLLGFPTFISTFTFSLVQLGYAGARRILELMADETEVASASTGEAHDIVGRITFDDVTFGYGLGAEPVLRDLSFTVEPGQTVAIVGETGSGKSTLTKLVNRTYDVDSGRILIDGIDIREYQLDSLRSQISTIEQDITLFSRTIEENIAFGRGGDATHEEVVAAAEGAAADGFIGELRDGYDTIIGERGVTLSGGQRQRLAIARALLTSPSILVLDDSTSAVDSETEDLISRAIHRVLQGRTTLLITHRLSQIRTADVVLLIRRGRLVESGSHEELLERSALYRRIFAHYDEIEAPATAAIASTGTGV
jgi:ATP-binding cassette subfamily B protein